MGFSVMERLILGLGLNLILYPFLVNSSFNSGTLSFLFFMFLHFMQGDVL